MGKLAADLIEVVPASRLVYATDFADSPENCHRLVELTAGAHPLICEDCFLNRDAD